ncbi:MAG: radical SAM protein [Bacteroidaceae bacterium]|nr:radical SAM protein [Bacteroidaceae bacterium]MBQ9293747.1 radical SAM protein [Bacteroidaceae bacterium]
MKGTIFSIEEFAINDGPGIRTTVFMKGCPLRCEWCHNPEGLSPNPQLMKKRDETVMSGKEIDSSELAKQLLRNEKIFKLNKGGVTFTGGEPLMQADFLLEVLCEIRPHIHCAIETSGYASEEVFGKVLDNLDFVLFDCKQTDDKLHKRYTRVSNRPILRNLSILKESGKDFVLRIPLIPGANDTKENFLGILNLARDAQHLQRVELLRYNKMAGAKYSMVGMEYKPSFNTDAEPRLHTDILEEAGVKVLVL